MENLWEPALKIAFIGEGLQSQSSGSPRQQLIPEVIPTITDALKAMPRTIHAHFITEEDFLWSSLKATDLTIPTSDLTLKYGGVIPGQWRVVYILDAWADAGTPRIQRVGAEDNSSMVYSV